MAGQRLLAKTRESTLSGRCHKGIVEYDPRGSAEYLTRDPPPAHVSHGRPTELNYASQTIL